MMDADNYAKALKKADDPTIVEIALTTDGEENDSYGRTAREIQNQREQEQLEQLDRDNVDGGTQQDTERDEADMNARMPAINIIWSRDSNKLRVVRRDSRKVADLFVINSLAQPRPTLETYRYAMPGEANIPQSEVHVFDRTSKQRVTIKADQFTDQTVQLATMPQPVNVQRDPRRPIAAAVAERLAREALSHALESRSAPHGCGRRRHDDRRRQDADRRAAQYLHRVKAAAAGGQRQRD